MTDLQPISPLRESILELAHNYNLNKSNLSPSDQTDMEEYLDILRKIADVAEDVERTELQEKHLPTHHNQDSHGGLHNSMGQRVYTRRSSMASLLIGKKVKGKKIKSVFKTGDSKIRQVLFTDGSRRKVPAAILSKMAYGPGTKSDVGKLFKSTQSLRKAGFVSYAQANYLYNENRTAFYKVMALAKSGQRYWDPQQQKMVHKDQ